MSGNKKKILASLEPMFKKAEKEGLYFFWNYQGLWLSPEKLKEYHKKGEFVWGPTNWELRDPAEKTVQLERKIEEAKKELADWKRDIQ